MAGRRLGPGYSGPLLDQILLPDRRARQRRISNGPWIVDPTHKAQDAEIVQAGRRDKFRALFQHYKIDPEASDCWQQLATCLAIQHVPGFQVTRAAGAPVKATVGALCRLYYYVSEKNAVRPAAPLTDSALCRNLVKDKEFKSKFPEFADCSPKRLQNLLVRARKLRKARAEYEARKLAGRWEGDGPPWFYPNLFA